MGDASTNRHLRGRGPAFVPRSFLTFTQLHLIDLLSLVMGETGRAQERIFSSSGDFVFFGLCSGSSSSSSIGLGIAPSHSRGVPIFLVVYGA